MIHYKPFKNFGYCLQFMGAAKGWGNLGRACWVNPADPYGKANARSACCSLYVHAWC